MKSIIKELGVIEELVLNRASPAEIRPHLLKMRTKLNAKFRTLQKFSTLNAAHALLQDAHSTLQNAHSDLDKKFREEVTRLKANHAKAEKNFESQILGYHLRRRI